eukprot:65009-Chlamydomonas_euryale.AAC.2
METLWETIIVPSPVAMAGCRGCRYHCMHAWAAFALAMLEEGDMGCHGSMAWLAAGQDVATVGCTCVGMQQQMLPAGRRCPARHVYDRGGTGNCERLLGSQACHRSNVRARAVALG